MPPQFSFVLKFSSSSVMESSLFTTIRPLIIISKITGFTLFTIDSKLSKISIKKLEIFNIISIIFINLTLNCIYWKSYINFSMLGGTVASHSLPILIYLDYLRSVVAVTWFYTKRHEIFGIFLKFVEIDEKLLELNVKFDNKRQKKNLISIILLTFSVHLTFAVSCGLTIFIYKFSKNSFLAIFTSWTIICEGIMFLNMFIPLLAIRISFTAINRVIKVETFTEFEKIHLKVTKLIQIYNEIYSPMMLIQFSISFGWYCVGMFHVVMLTREIWENFPGIVLMNFVRLGCNFGTMFVLIKMCETTLSERERCALILHESVMEVDEKEVRERTFQFLTQIQQTARKFSCGFFDFTWKFLFKVRNLIYFWKFYKLFNNLTVFLNLIIVHNSWHNVFHDFSAI